MITNKTIITYYCLLGYVTDGFAKDAKKKFVKTRNSTTTDNYIQTLEYRAEVLANMLTVDHAMASDCIKELNDRITAGETADHILTEIMPLAVVAIDEHAKEELEAELEMRKALIFKLNQGIRVPEVLSLIDEEELHYLLERWREYNEPIWPKIIKHFTPKEGE